MLTCGMEHFVEDDEMRGTSAKKKKFVEFASLKHYFFLHSGKRASDVSADDAIAASDAVRRSNFLPTSHRIRCGVVDDMKLLFFLFVCQSI